jgi:hypothetical protein
MEKVEDTSQVKLIDFGGIKMPAVSLGTSPFIGAAQFGPKAIHLRERFLNHPENMVTLIVKAAGLGVPSIQVLPFPEIIYAVKVAQKQTEKEIATYFTVGIGDIEVELSMAAEIGSKIVFIHGSISDRCDERELVSLYQKISSAGFIPGIATHQPDKTIPWVENSGLKFKVYMVPINPLGYLMGKDPDYTIELLKESKKKVIAKKILAAGKVSPHEGLSYLRSLNIVDGLTVGITSLEEMDQTFKIALNLWPRY